jgi:TIR domain
MGLREVTGGACSMRVFISWSGDLSRRLAEAIHKWLPDMLQYVKPYFTPADIEKGAKWDLEISKELEASNFCIITLTRESLDSKWIMFEAGAISKSIERARLCTVLFGIEPTDVEGPLERFQATKFLKEEIHKLLKTINSNAKEEALPDAALDRVFEKWWPDLEDAVNEIMKDAGSSTKVAVREPRDLLEEAVSRLRAISEEQSQIRQMVLGITQIAAFNPSQNAIINALLRGQALAGSTHVIDQPPTGNLLTGAGTPTVDVTQKSDR